MSKFKKKRGASSPAISTASLPDIIFMLLFFFMVVTVMKDSSLKVAVNIPEATELSKLERKSLVNHIYIGRPLAKWQPTAGTSPRIQLNDAFGSTEDIPLFLEKEKLNVLEAMHPFITTSLRVDKDITMGIVADVKTALRKAGQTKINYSAKARGNKGI